jgi:hypothetical protein
MTDQGSLAKEFEPAFIPPDRRYRLYFDETGTGDIYSAQKDDRQRYLSLTALVIRQDVHDTTITNSLNKLKIDIFGEENASIILHRREIMDKKGVFSVLKDEALRSRFDEGFKKIVSDLPIPAFTVSIDKLEHLNKYKTWQFNPYHYVMTCLLERFVLWLHRTANLGDVLGEARNPTHDGQLRRAFRRFYKEGTTVRAHIIRAKLSLANLNWTPKRRTLQLCKLQTCWRIQRTARSNLNKKTKQFRTTTARRWHPYS